MTIRFAAARKLELSPVALAVTWYGVFDMATIAAQAKQDKATSRDVLEAPEWQLLGCVGNECKPKQIAAARSACY
jgi:hypothetical protein